MVRWKRVKNDLIYVFVRLLLALGAHLPLAAGRPVGAALGALAYLVLSRERRMALSSLSRAFPERSAAWRAVVARASFRHLGVSAFEAFRLLRGRRDEVLSLVSDVRNLATLDRALARGKGVLCVTGHFGNWEWMGAWFAARGYPSAVVAQRVYDPRFDALANAARERLGITVHPRGASVRDLLRTLRAGRMIGLLCDQDTDVESVHVPFFGHPAKTPSGPVVLAQASGAALLPFFTSRGADGRHEIRIGEPIAVPPRGAEPGQVARAVGAYTAALEQEIRLRPEQWVWIHERWKSAAAAAFVALFAAGCSGSSRSDPGQTGPAHGKKPAIVVQNLSGVGTDKGVKVSEYRARSAELSDDQKTANAHEIEFAQFRNHRKICTLRADRGVFSLETNDGEATGNVVLITETGARLETGHLRWSQTKNRLASDDDVRVTKGGNVLTGRGLDADPNLDQIRIRSNVQMEVTDLGALEETGTSGATPAPSGTPPAPIQP